MVNEVGDQAIDGRAEVYMSTGPKSTLHHVPQSLPCSKASTEEYPLIDDLLNVGDEGPAVRRGDHVSERRENVLRACWSVMCVTIEYGTHLSEGMRARRKVLYDAERRQHQGIPALHLWRCAPFNEDDKREHLRIVLIKAVTGCSRHSRNAYFQNAQTLVMHGIEARSQCSEAVPIAPVALTLI